MRVCVCLSERVRECVRACECECESERERVCVLVCVYVYVCVIVCEAIRCFLNPTTNTTANKFKTLFSAEVKGSSGAFQMIVYPCPERTHDAVMHHIAKPFL
jgi:hypothetical protein